MTVRVYERLFALNLAFDQVRRSLAALRRDPFDRAELDRYSQLAEECRAATNSYLTGVIETNETEEAGHRFRQRLARERADEQRR